MAFLDKVVQSLVNSVLIIDSNDAHGIDQLPLVAIEQHNGDMCIGSAAG